jgi:glycosyltransferase involved in cell wall biosynthesis
MMQAVQEAPRAVETVNHRPPRKLAERCMRLAYLTTEYPKVSHTFIRRELVELENRGHSMLRLAIRDAGDAIADTPDIAESERTVHLLKQPKVRLLKDALKSLVRNPIGAMRAFACMWRLNRRSDRGVIRHVAYLLEAAALLPIVQREDIEHIHVHFGTNAASVALLLRKLGGPPFSMTIHGPDEFDAPVGHSLKEKIAGASFVVAISDYCSAQILRWADLNDWWKVHVIGCPVDEKFFHGSSPLEAQSNTFLCIGRLASQKGQLLLLEAMARLVEDGMDAQLVLAGDGEMRAALEERIAQLDLKSRVLITGWVDESRIRQLLQECRALVLPSFAEGLPVVIMEALAMQRTVISTSVGAIGELVRNGETGWLIPPANVDALAAAMREVLLMDAQGLTKRADCGRRLVFAHHNAAAEAEKLEELLARAIKSEEKG